MDRIEKHLRAMQNRTMGSLAVFAVFLAIAFFLGFQGKTLDQQLMLFWVVPLICAIVILPREVYPTAWPRGENDDEQARIDMIRTELTQLHSRVIYTRVGYLMLVLLVVGLIPKLGV